MKSERGVFKYSKGKTLNTGNYTSLRLDVGMEVPVDIKDGKPDPKQVKDCINYIDKVLEYLEEQNYNNED